MKRILLVDDNESFRKPLGEVLRKSGYEVQTAAEGAAALRLFRQQPFDLVVTDLVMPGMEGIETIIEIRRIAPRAKIIAMSGGGRISPEDYLEMARHLGAARTLAKPFTAREFLESIAGVLNGGGFVPAAGAA